MLWLALWVRFSWRTFSARSMEAMRSAITTALTYFQCLVHIQYTRTCIYTSSSSSFVHHALSNEDVGLELVVAMLLLIHIRTYSTYMLVHTHTHTQTTHTLTKCNSLSCQTQTNLESDAVTDLVSVAEDIGVSVASGLEREQTRKNYTNGNLSECSWEDCKCAQWMQVGFMER